MIPSYDQSSDFRDFFNPLFIKRVFLLSHCAAVTVTLLVQTVVF